MKVLVPYDGTELSEQAGVMAIELLAQYRLDLLLVRAVADPRHLTMAQESLDAVAKRLAYSPATVTPLLAIGRPDKEVVQFADHHGADLIAMSTHGRSLPVRMLLGSVTDRVIRTSPVPVLVVHPPTMSVDRLSPPAGRNLRLLAPLDGSPFAEEAVCMALSLLRPDRVEVTLMTALAAPELESTMHAKLQATASRLQARGATVSLSIARGDAATEIVRYGADGRYDLVVMSTHGHGMLTRALIGGTTDRVVRTSEVPVLVIQPHWMEVPYDPVSGEEIDPETAAYTSEYQGRVFSFSTREHKQQFDSTPEAYAGRRPAYPRRYASPVAGMARGPLTHQPEVRETSPHDTGPRWRAHPQARQHDADSGKGGLR